jgi:hypothetical protein
MAEKEATLTEKGKTAITGTTKTAAQSKHEYRYFLRSMYRELSIYFDRKYDEAFKSDKKQ